MNDEKDEQDAEYFECEEYRMKTGMAKRATHNFNAKLQATSMSWSSSEPNWSQFKKIHEVETLHKSDKFQYLLQAIEDETEAKELVNTFPATGENYEKAFQALRERYGDEGLLLQVYIRELLKLMKTMQRLEDT